MCGAFSGLEKIISARGRSASIEFSANVIASEDRRAGEVFRDVEPEDLLKYGLIPEFVGRLPVVATLEDLDESAFRIRFFGRTTGNLACSYPCAVRLRVRPTRHVAPQRLDALAPRLAKQAKLARGFRRPDCWEVEVMHIFMFRCGIASLMLAAFLAVGPRALAEIVSFRADLKGASEVPPTDSKGIGTVSVKYDPATRMVSWMVNYSGLTGNATGAYFHGPASITQNAEVAVPVNGDLTGPIEGAATLNATEAADLMSGNWYFNIYSADHKGGEMRGQVLKGM